MMFKKGFTLIELLVVISIIGVLSSVVLTSVNAARSRARDTKKKADLAQVQKALELYYDTYGTYSVAGGGYAGGGEGWLSYTDGGIYQQSVTGILYQQGFLSTPSIETGTPNAMIYVCGTTYALSVTLENPSSEDIAKIQTTCNGTGGNGTYTSYGKNYAVSN